jgi:hypothetical protein
MKLDDVENSVKYLAETDELHAELTSHYESMKDSEKHVKGKFVSNNGLANLPVSKLEHNFYASKEFLDILKMKKDCLKALHDIKNKRQTAIYKIEIWRTLEASRRKGNV